MDLEERKAVTAGLALAQDQQLDQKWRYSCCVVRQQLTGVGAVCEACQLLAKTVVLGMLCASVGGGHIPNHKLLRQLCNNNTSRPATTGRALQ